MLSTALLFASCKHKEDVVEDEKKTVVVAETYTGDFTANTPSTTVAADNLEALASKIKSGKDVAVTVADLNAFYQNGDTSLEDMASVQYKTWATALFTNTENASAASSSGTVIDFTNIAGTPNGGKAGKRLFDGSPIEPGQLVEKGAFGGVCFSYVKNTLFASPAAVTQEDLDKALVLLGTEPTFSTKRFSAKYAGKRAYGNGTYLDQINYEFRKAQSSIKQDITADKVAAVNAITALWEEAMMAQAIHYLYGSSEQFADNNLVYDDAGYIGAIHGWSEAVGFIRGFYQVAGTKITDTQLESVLTKINAPVDGAYDVLPLIGSPTQLADVTSAINDLAAIYGFTPSIHK